MIPVYTFTNDNHLFLLRGYSYLWNEYADHSSYNTVVGFTHPEFDMPVNFKFYSLGKQLPKEKWSDGLIQLCELLQSDWFILMLEDFWLTDFVDRLALNELKKWFDDSILRIDLSGNRASYKQARIIGKCMEYDMVETGVNVPYQMSFQAGIWNRKLLLSLLKKGESPWEVEIEGSKRITNERIIGTSSAIMKYQPVWRCKRQQWQVDKIPTAKLEYMKSEGMLDVRG
jgi:hypothetical protein